MHAFPGAIIPVIVILIALLFVGRVNRNFDYQCPECGATFSISFWQAALSPHMMRKKYVRCPDCGTMGWATAVRR